MCIFKYHEYVILKRVKYSVVVIIFYAFHMQIANYNSQCSHVKILNGRKKIIMSVDVGVNASVYVDMNVYNCVGVCQK